MGHPSVLTEPVGYKIVRRDSDGSLVDDWCDQVFSDLREARDELLVASRYQELVGPWFVVGLHPVGGHGE